jgi:hypothetical protein
MAEKREAPVTPQGMPKSLKAAILGAGADLLQDTTPVKQFDIYVVGFHCAKYHPQMQMEAHHYCHQVNEEFLQCVLFDGNTEDANLIGIEYIISERLFHTLPEEEKRYWHPHNYEILSGQLVAPGLPELAEKEMLKLLMNSYGKTWHVWHTGRHDREDDPGDTLPLGDPMLMWSFNRDGEADPGLDRDRQERMDINSKDKRRNRQDLVELAHPQCGVDDLAGVFPNAAMSPPPGVVQAESCPDDPEL